MKPGDRIVTPQGTLGHRVRIVTRDGFMATAFCSKALYRSDRMAGPENPPCQRCEQRYRRAVERGRL